jgi:L-fuculose-phosphate aldolase
MMYETERAAIVATLKEMVDSGLVINTSGNVSMKIDNHVLLSPSGASYATLVPSDILVMDQDKNILDGSLLPSSETGLHYALYASNKDIKAIVHTHSLYATAVSNIVNELPAVHYQIVDLGGMVPVAPYETFGSPELASAVTTHIRGRSAVLMQNHGAVTIGDNLREALNRSILLEWLSSLFLISSHEKMPPSSLTEQQLRAVVLQKQKYSDLRRAYKLKINSA